MDTRILKKMRSDWNDRAKENAQYYVQNERKKWDQRDFFRSGEINVANEVMSDMVAICGGQRSPLDLRMLEIGCGVGRMTRMLSRIFGHVTGVDISEEMIRQARENTADLPNVDLMLGDGGTLAGLPDATYDFAFSFIVFQHIPAYSVIASYCREVYRILKPRGLFKFQVQGHTGLTRNEMDTWVGYPISTADANRLADESGFDIERQSGAGSQWYWLWFRKLA
ncbi:MAG: class I SAM-dependent methyltransferase [Acidobacteriia bacterium]|nr:class I SAM-dependent methyltransferase [Terriglobia bacterium]MBV9743481.1 class I SAM-dependent methyltransferase [Terriglobia bacterium]